MARMFVIAVPLVGRTMVSITLTRKLKRRKFDFETLLYVQNFSNNFIFNIKTIYFGFARIKQKSILFNTSKPQIVSIIFDTERIGSRNL